ncbi:AraC family transcriptional regulator [Alginatibacterium sediminis]|uniref:AraC family transcriptional regulator n=1 Tax=Alginatibacterium sediminis TaxID=2164068 RepID=A0A420EBE0_9ALTE|nr:AraC family transcriptional regulator [Alginatibacterium sediminis]RKF17995.1 AraC family transcriptional regulator [Alginatibacterium sediminis]
MSNVPLNVQQCLAQRERLVSFRTIGSFESGNQLGFGFMFKPGITIDFANYKLPYYSACYVIRGRGVYTDALGKNYQLKPGSLFQRHPEVEHSTTIDPNSDWAECYIDFGQQIYQFMVNMNIINPEQVVANGPVDPMIEAETYRLLVELQASSEHNLADLLLQSSVLLRRILNRELHVGLQESSHNFIEKSCKDFTLNYHKRIDLRQYCTDNGVGYESFRKSFKKSLGVSPSQYIIHRRVDMACQMLSVSARSISKIADELGYCSQHDFSTQFKRITGTSPKSYRRSMNTI